MKILWVNSSFLDYRIPVYKRLNELSGGNFYIVYSRTMVPERIPQKIEAAIGNHAIAIDDKQLCIGKSDTLANKNLKIPRPSGLYKAIKEVNPDIIIGEGFFQWTPFALRYSITHRKPLFIGYERTKWTERDCPKWRALYRKVVDKFTRGYLCNGILTKEYLMDELKVSEKKITTGTMSADSEGLAKASLSISPEERAAFKRSLGLHEEGITYLYSGYLIPRKGVDYLLQAWMKHIQTYPKDQLLLVGGGELQESLSKTYGGEKSIHFMGTVVYDTIYRYYNAADVFVIPTLEDNWSLVVPEAMACGLPVACSVYNGCYPELVHEGENGALFDPLDVKSTVKALDYFHHVDLEQQGARSIEIEKQYNTERVAQNIFNALMADFK